MWSRITSFDAQSAVVFLRDLAARYRARALGGPEGSTPLTTTFGRHVASDPDAYVPSEASAVERLSGCPPVCTIPPDRARPAVASHRGRAVPVDLGPDLGPQVLALARRLRATANAVLLAAVATVLGRASGSTKVALGMPDARRREPAAAAMIGCLAGVNVVPVPLTEAATAAELIHLVHRAVAAVVAHPVPFTRLVELVATQRDPGRNPLFQTMVSLRDGSDETDVEAAGVALRLESVQAQHTDFDMFWSFVLHQDTVHGELAYNCDLYLAETARWVVDEVVSVLARWVKDPDRTVVPPEDGPQADAVVDVTATFTADPVLAPLRFWFGSLRWRARAAVRPVGQVVQQLLAGPTADVHVVLLRWADWLATGTGDEPVGVQAVRHLDDLLAALRAFRARSTAPVIVLVCPTDAVAVAAPPGLLARLDDRLAATCAEIPGVQVGRVEDWLAVHPVARVFDPRAESLGLVPYTEELFALVATLVARQLHRLAPGGPAAPGPEPTPDDRLLWSLDPRAPGVPGEPPPEGIARLVGPERLAHVAGELASPAAVVRASRSGGVRHADDVVVPASTESEERLCALWRRALHLREVGVTSDFFALGGHSLLATTLLGEVAAELGCDVTLHDLFIHPTVRELAAVVDLRGGTGRQPIPRVAGRDRAPVTSMQGRLWALDQFGDEVQRHNTGYAAWLDGPVDVDALEAAVSDVVAAHEALRTTFHASNGSVVQRVQANVDAWVPAAGPDDGDDRDDDQGQVEVWLEHHLRHRYDLSLGPLFRVGLLRLRSDRHVLAVGMHHIICDDVSWGIVLRDLATAYTRRVTGGPTAIEAPTLQLADVAAFREQELATTLDGHLTFWRRALAELPEVQGGTVAGQGQTRDGGEAGRVRETIPAAEETSIDAFAREEAVTRFAVVMAAFAELVRQDQGTADIVIAVPAAQRDRQELADVVGCLADLVPIRVSTAGRPSFRQLVRKVHEAAVEAFAHQDAPLLSILAAVQESRGPGSVSVFRHICNVVDRPEPQLWFGAVPAAPIETPPAGIDVDLFLTVARTSRALELVLDHDLSTHPAQASQDLVGRLRRLLVAGAGSPDLPLPDESVPPATPAGDPQGVEGARRQVLVAACGDATPWTRVLAVHAAAAGVPLQPVALRPTGPLWLLLDPMGPLHRDSRQPVVLVFQWQELLTDLIIPGSEPSFRPRLADALTRRCHELASGLDLLTGRKLVLVVAQAATEWRSPSWRAVLGSANERLQRAAARAGATVVEMPQPGSTGDEPDMDLLAAVVRAVWHGLPDEDQWSGAVAQKAATSRRPGRLPSAEAASVVDGRARTPAADMPPFDPTRPDDDADMSWTGTRRVMARLWADVLRLGEVHLHDDFFALGGDSLSAMRVVARANDHGIAITARDLVARPTLAELCPSGTGVGDDERAEEPVGPTPLPTGPPVPVTGAQAWFLDLVACRMQVPSWFNHPTYLLLRRPVAPELLSLAVSALADQHDALRLRFSRDEGRWQQRYAPAGADGVPLVSHDLSGLAVGAREAAAAALAAEAQRSLDLKAGPVVTALHLRLGAAEPERLLLVPHHLVTDGFSRGLLLDDLRRLVEHLERAEAPRLPAPTTAYTEWAEQLQRYAGSAEIRGELPFWLAQAAGAEPRPDGDEPDAPVAFHTLRELEAELPAQVTQDLLEATRRLGVSVRDVLLWAVAGAVTSRTGRRDCALTTTGHGREAAIGDVDLRRTVGWFQVMYPVRLRVPPGPPDAASLPDVSNRLARVPHGGIGHGLLRHCCPDPDVRARLVAVPQPRISVNYTGDLGLGEVEAVPGADSLFGDCSAPTGPSHDPQGLWPIHLDVVGALAGANLRLGANYGGRVYSTAMVRELIDDVADRLSHVACG